MPLIFAGTEELDEWLRQRDDMVARSTAEHFSNDIVMSKKDMEAQSKLLALRTDLLQKDPAINTGNYYEKLPSLLNSALYECLNAMPKPAVHHVQLSAACPLEFLIGKLTYYDFVYYNEKEQKFIVNKNGCDNPGYIKTNDLR